MVCIKRVSVNEEGRRALRVAALKFELKHGSDTSRLTTHWNRLVSDGLFIISSEQHFPGQSMLLLRLAPFLPPQHCKTIYQEDSLIGN